MNNTRKVPGRPGKGVGPKVENPGKMLKTLMAYILKSYKIHVGIVVVAIFVSVLANVQGTMFTKILIDQYILPLLQSDQPDFMPLELPVPICTTGS